ncbi:MAG: bacteriohemerythrin [Thiohalomonadaceae bacterium]
MYYFVWDSSLETGIDIIDSQHKRIVDYINQLHDAIADKSNEDVEQVLNQLIDYTVTHFTFEESLQEKAGYGHVEAHRKVHEAFTARIKEYKTRFEKGEDISKKLLSDLRIWLTNHIKQEDRDYSATVKAHLNGDHDRGWLTKTLSRLFGG